MKIINVEDIKELKGVDLNTLPVGKHDLGEGNFVKILEMDLQEDALWESHKVYTDIHVPLKEMERMEYTTGNTYNITKPYSDEMDIDFGTIEGEYEEVIASPGEGVIFIPGELHKPTMIVDEKKPQRKALIKIKGDQYK